MTNTVIGGMNQKDLGFATQQIRAKDNSMIGNKTSYTFNNMEDS
jgi:hypothetical protein